MNDEYFMGHKKSIRKVKNLASRRHGYYQTKRAGMIYFQSSYELKAALILDDDERVDTFSTQLVFYSLVHNRKRFIDYLVKMKDGSTLLIEIKPFSRLIAFKEQLDDNRDYAESKGWNFEVWTEKELGFNTAHAATKWADDFLSKLQGVDFVEQRRIRSQENTRKHRQKFPDERIDVWCDFCKIYHIVLLYSYENNIARNGEYICEKHGGHIAGKKAKLSLRKNNPYLAEGKMQCNRCKEIKSFDDFSPNNGKGNGLHSQCKKCRAEIYRNKYQEKRAKQKESDNG